MRLIENIHVGEEITTIESSNEFRKEISTIELRDSLHNAIENCSDFDYDFYGCRQYTIGDTNVSIGLIPIEDERRPVNKTYGRGAPLSASYKESCLKIQMNVYEDKAHFWTLENNEALIFIEKVSDKYDRKNLKNGAIEYPENWTENEDLVLLNESMELEKDVLRDSIIEVLKKEDKSVFEKEDGEYYVSVDSNSKGYHLCSLCGNENSCMVIRSENFIEELPRCPVCLSCIPEFMSRYLDADKSKIKRIQVSKDL